MGRVLLVVDKEGNRAEFSGKGTSQSLLSSSETVEAFTGFCWVLKEEEGAEGRSDSVFKKELSSTMPRYCSKINLQLEKQTAAIPHCFGSKE